jgi:succinate dehydrogenase/fumarate reductase flavoprotein subunit
VTAAAYDLIVIGAGAGGLTAALTGALEGARVLVLEKTGQIGGTTARSSGSVWVPGNAQQAPLGIAGDRQRALAYLDALVGERADRALRLRYLDVAPRMLADLGARAGIAFRVYPHAPDYRPDLPGALAGGRALEPVPFDGRRLGATFARVRSTLPEFLLFGGMMVTRAEVAQLLRLPFSVPAAGLALRLTARYGWDRTRYARGTRLVLGNALAARLYHASLARGVEVRFGANVVGLVRAGERIAGVTLERAGERTQIAASGAVVLAGGGFPADAALRRRFFPVPVAETTPAFEGCTGDTLRLAETAGAAIATPGGGSALWFPSSIAQRPDGTTAVYPHIVLDRAKPGLIAVDAAGERFVDEAAPYHEFVRAMYARNEHVAAIPAWLVCDARFLRRYGLGIVRPRALRPRRWTASGYLRTAPALEALAAAIGVDAAGLRRSVDRHNAFARCGHDADFGKGANVYDRSNGDPRHAPNPCLGTIERGPFYAVAVVPTPLGTSTGLRTNDDAQVLDRDGRAMRGLYACGNDMEAPFGGEYPGAGAQLGAALTFGYVAALHALGRTANG